MPISDWPMAGLPTMPQRFAKTVADRGDQIALRAKRADESWLELTWNDLGYHGVARRLPVMGMRLVDLYDLYELSPIAPNGSFSARMVHCLGPGWAAASGVVDEAARTVSIAFDSGVKDTGSLSADCQTVTWASSSFWSRFVPPAKVNVHIAPHSEFEGRTGCRARSPSRTRDATAHRSSRVPHASKPHTKLTPPLPQSPHSS
jgi:hypothetical protein